MGSVFDSAFEVAAAPSLLAQFGVEATYTPYGGDPITITVIVDREEIGEEDNERGRTREYAPTVTLPTTATAAAETDSGNYVATVDQRATITIGSDVLHIRRVLTQGPMTTVECASRAAMERTMPGYRRGGR